MDGGEKGLLGKRVLVVEDEYYIAKDITDALEKLGARVIGPVGTKEEAMERLRETEVVDLAVLDINLHGEAIYSVADELSRRAIPYVFATGYDPTAIPEAYRDRPRWQKPFDPDELAGELVESMAASKEGS
ncbi:response regulator [Aurantimonas sp. 22II-16-19i]|uniref:response regulator n=1 Tax=Aurantimonas sp. 22II-16-19i TaxID=1317114 RepID=UPI0009F7BE3A|nr:response regulator [Aurantimonas sp. 22II-16-19i]ORE90581.1 response regulator receiver protein [Aurantimonas sp. 22II-16-19i]